MRSQWAATAKLVREALDEVEPLMRAAFAEVNGSPEPGTPLDQVNLLDGRSVVEDYLDHNELGLAFDHLLYMVTEPPLRLPPDCFSRLKRIVEALGHANAVLEGIEVQP
jgi:hypothetical protein